ncbi:MAG: Cof-type HAD-IIB family hydrolase [Lonepinella koalarum]|nr:Cof-type HAD-IIB family hydrolase [Lonepinella koalarum]
MLNNTKYKAVFSDIDGTLLNNQHQITPKTEQAIKSIAQQGIPFIPVSARPPKAITPYAEQLQINQPIVCYSGALILDKDFNELRSVLIEEQDLAQLKTFLADYQHLCINYYVGFNWFVNDEHNFWAKRERDITGVNYQPCPQNLTEAHKVLIMGEPTEIQTLERKLKEKLPHLSIHRSLNEYLEIMNNTATKANAIRFMESILNVKTEEVIAFGDNFNDLDMLQYAGLGIAMGNAPVEIKSIADEVTADNNNDGIALVLNREFRLY